MITSGGNRTRQTLSGRQRDGRLEVDAPVQCPQPATALTAGLDGRNRSGWRGLLAYSPFPAVLGGRRQGRLRTRFGGSREIALVGQAEGGRAAGVGYSSGCVFSQRVVLRWSARRKAAGLPGVG
jgi:hypothetical protein